MLDITLIREHPELVRKALNDRQMDSTPVDRVLEIDAQRRKILTEVETLKAERNSVSREISRIKDPDERQPKIEAMRVVGEKIAELDGNISSLENDLREIVASLPNLPAQATPRKSDCLTNQPVILKYS